MVNSIKKSTKMFKTTALFTSFLSVRVSHWKRRVEAGTLINKKGKQINWIGQSWSNIEYWSILECHWRRFNEKFCFYASKRGIKISKSQSIIAWLNNCQLYCCYNEHHYIVFKSFFSISYWWMVHNWFLFDPFWVIEVL